MSTTKSESATISAISDQSENPVPTQTSGLYLYTFLATLLLLLSVSVFIITRSFIYRRRFRRRFEEALRNGQVITSVDPAYSGFSHKWLGPTPVLWELWIARGGYRWEDLSPISAEIVCPQRTQIASRRGLNIPHVIRLPTRRARSPPPPAQRISSIPSLVTSASNPKLRVTTLIAMPTRGASGTGRPHLDSRGSSEGGSTWKGKGKSVGDTPETSSALWNNVPPIMFGVTDLEIDWGEEEGV